MTVLGLILLVVSLYVYLALARQIASRPVAELPAEKQFGPVEVAVALTLISILLLSLVNASKVQRIELTTGMLITSIVYTAGLVLFIAAILKLRGFSLTGLTGVTKLSFERALVTGIVLLVLAYPLVLATDWIMMKTGGVQSSRQEIVELFSNSHSLPQRILVIILAVAIAPIAEEFVFRFFLYGVIRRYGGRSAALLVTGLLFGSVHAHLPSFAPLFVLASCLALAYEWSGSLLVPMTMHSLFNGLTMIALAFPETLAS